MMNNQDNQLNANRGVENNPQSEFFFVSVSESVKLRQLKREALKTSQVSNAQPALAQVSALVAPALAPAMAAPVQVVPMVPLQGPQDQPARIQDAGLPVIQDFQEDLDLGDEVDMDSDFEDEQEEEPEPMDEGEEEELEPMDEGEEEENDLEKEDEDEALFDDSNDEPIEVQEQMEEPMDVRPAAEEGAPAGEGAQEVPEVKLPGLLSKSTMKKLVLEQPRMENVHGIHVTSHVRRIDLLKMAPNKMRQTINVDICYLCNEKGGKEGLGRCEGNIAESVRCSNRCHPSCAAKYNAGGITIQHAAEAYSQNKVLCGLHACAACDGEGRKRDAYSGHIIGCMVCVKGYHPCCFPAGAKKEIVEVRIGRKKVEVQMMKCLGHREDADTSQTKHFNSCMHCGEKKKDLQNCSKCIQAFHPDCRKVQTVDRIPVRPDVCDGCISQATINLNSLVLFPDRKTWRMATVVECSQTSGMARVQQEGEDAVVEMAVSELVPMKEKYLKNAPRAQKTDWKRKWQEACSKKEEEMLNLKDHRDFQMRKGLKICTSEIPKVNIRKQDKHEDCQGYAEANCECPLRCRSSGRCKNPNLVTNSTHPSLELVDCGKKGKGVVATDEIPEKTCLGQYTGEVQTEVWRTEDEKKKALAGDLQVSKYYFGLDTTTIIDAASWGNITRFFNHSCAPNAKVVKIFKFNVREKKKEVRLLVKTIRKIEVEEEITIDYNWEEFKKSCFCGTNNCRSKYAS